jgi:hypothetical protein
VPIITDVDHAKREVRAVAIGPVTFDDIKSHLSLERNFKGLAYPEMIDARAAAISLTPSEVEQTADLLRDLARGSKLGPTAVVVSDDSSFGVIRSIEALIEDVCEVKPFREEKEALAWLATQ